VSSFLTEKTAMAHLVKYAESLILWPNHPIFNANNQF
jgi:hypothetical protein